MSKEHAYRKGVHPKYLISFRVLIKETDLLVSASKDLSKQTRDRAHHYRRQLEDYIKSKPDFLSTLFPYPEDPFAPEIIREMISATKIFDIGPMAAVAGTIAQLVGRDLLKHTEELIVENGGDIFLKAKRPITVSIFAGSSKFNDKLGVVIYPEQMPTGICTSSATVGHSLSLGTADSVCIVANKASIADAAATALGNRITDRFKLKKEIESMRKYKDIKGGVVIIGKTMASWGEIELTKIY
ncbi:MAG: UPF0280 family protein [Proteobacteria bacterium]|nr:UPF0280 family protein [Pseudomonadota bacterium]